MIMNMIVMVIDIATRSGKILCKLYVFMVNLNLNILINQYKLLIITL